MTHEREKYEAMPTSELVAMARDRQLSVQSAEDREELITLLANHPESETGTEGERQSMTEQAARGRDQSDIVGGTDGYGSQTRDQLVAAPEGADSELTSR